MVIDFIIFIYIYKHNQGALTTYEELEEFISSTELCRDILSLDNSIDICDLVQEVWYICYNIKKYKKISESILYDIRGKLLRHSEAQGMLECRNIEIENNVFVKIYLNELSKIDTLYSNLIKDYFLNNMTYREISSKYNIPLNTVKRKIDKGLEIISNM